MNKNWPEKITKHYRQLINWQDKNDPLAKMVCFNPLENEIKKGELVDPIGDHNKEVVPGLIHRYPSSVLALMTADCPQNCRFCFRKNLNFKIDWQQIADYIKTNPQISEVIFSGGDPLILKINQWSTILNRLSRLKQIKSWRIHSRLPVVDPESLSNDFFKLWQKASGNLSLVIHVNHPQEISAKMLKLINKFRQNNWLVFSQTVLLKGVNDNQKILKQLFSKLWQNGIKPYYLHHLDKTKGTNHFRISIDDGLSLYQGLRGQIPGICLPEYVLDLPGGNGKVPVSWLKKIAKRKYQARNFKGKLIAYFDTVDLG